MWSVNIKKPKSKSFSNSEMLRLSNGPFSFVTPVFIVHESLQISKPLTQHPLYNPCFPLPTLTPSPLWS